MPNPNRRHGRATEIMVANYLAGAGWPHAEPTRRSGWADDRGDIDGIPGFTIEVKSAREWRVPEWLGELADEMVNAGNENGVLVVRRRGTTDVSRWYAMSELGEYVRLMQQAGW